MWLCSSSRFECFAFDFNNVEGLSATSENYQNENKKIHFTANRNSGNLINCYQSGLIDYFSGVKTFLLLMTSSEVLI